MRRVTEPCGGTAALCQETRSSSTAACGPIVSRPRSWAVSSWQKLSCTWPSKPLPRCRCARVAAVERLRHRDGTLGASRRKKAKCVRDASTRNAVWCLRPSASCSAQGHGQKRFVSAERVDQRKAERNGKRKPSKCCLPDSGARLPAPLAGFLQQQARRSERLCLFKALHIPEK